MKNGSPLKQYINKTIAKEAKIRYDKKLKQWYGILDHETGLICSQRATKMAVEKEIAEILEDFITLYFQDLDKKGQQKSKVKHEIKAPEIPRVYSQA